MALNLVSLLTVKYSCWYAVLLTSMNCFLVVHKQPCYTCSCGTHIYFSPKSCSVSFTSHMLLVYSSIWNLSNPSLSHCTPLPCFPMIFSRMRLNMQDIELPCLSPILRMIDCKSSYSSCSHHYPQNINTHYDNSYQLG